MSFLNNVVINLFKVTNKRSLFATQDLGVIGKVLIVCRIFFTRRFNHNGNYVVGHRHNLK